MKRVMRKQCVGNRKTSSNSFFSIFRIFEYKVHNHGNSIHIYYMELVLFTEFYLPDWIAQRKHSRGNKLKIQASTFFIREKKIRFHILYIVAHFKISSVRLSSSRLNLQCRWKNWIKKMPTAHLGFVNFLNGAHYHWHCDNSNAEISVTWLLVFSSIDVFDTEKAMGAAKSGKYKLGFFYCKKIFDNGKRRIRLNYDGKLMILHQLKIGF